MKKDQIIVTIGEQTFSPYKYHAFRVGPFEYSTTIQDDETPDEAFKRANDFLKEHFDKMFKVQMYKYFENLEMLNNAKPKA